MALPTLLGRGATKPGPAREAEKGPTARSEEGINRPAAEVSNKGNRHEAGECTCWISWQCLAALALALGITLFVSVHGLVKYVWFEMGGASRGVLVQTTVFTGWVVLTTVFAGWAACWLCFIAPTKHVLFAARFLLLNWCGGLLSLFFTPGPRIGFLWLELLSLQYLAHDRLKTFWPALKSPRWGAFLGCLFWLELAAVVFQNLLGTARIIALQNSIVDLSDARDKALLVLPGATIILFLTWLCGVAHTLCLVVLLLRRTLRMTRDEANTIGRQAQLSGRRSALLQATGLMASLVSTMFLICFAGAADFGSIRSVHLYLAAQCVNSMVNVLGVVLLSKAHEVLSLPRSARPPALPWFRCRPLCQRRAKSPKDVSSKGPEWDMKTADLASRGIALSDLLAFYQSLGGSIMESFQPAVHTTNDVVRLAIIPLTSGTCSSYAQMVNDGKEVTPKKMVTHNWSNLFRDLVATVIADVLREHSFELVAALLSDREGIKVIEETVKVQDCLGETYWICAFAVNQHAGICGANPNGDLDPVTRIPHPICSCGTAKFFNTDPPLNDQGESIQCEMNKFDDMMAFLAQNNPNFGELVAVDADLNLFGRAWCIAELAEAHRMGMAQRLMVRNKETLMRRQGTLQGLQVENMKASRPEDVEQILAKIPDKEAFNQKLQDLIFDGQVGLLAAWKKADIEQQMEDLSHVLKWAKISESVPHGELIWRKWMVPVD